MDKVKINEEFRMLRNEIYKNECFERKGNSKLITFKYLLPFKMPLKESENIDFITEENTFMIFSNLEEEFLEKGIIKQYRKSYVEITSIINHKQFNKLKSNSTSRESKQNDNRNF